MSGYRDRLRSPRGELGAVVLTAGPDRAFDPCGRERFAAGDFDETDDSIRHQPVVESGGECICLASVEGRIAFDGRVARVLGALVGM